MKSMQAITMLSILVAFSLSACAQNHADSLAFIAQRLSNSVYKSYRPDADSLKHCCEIGCVFTYFKVDGNGKIVDLAFNQRSPMFIRLALGKAIDSLKQDAKLMKALAGLGKGVLMPVIYYYKNGCHIPQDPGWTTDAAVRKKYLEQYVDATEGIDRPAEMVNFMLNLKGHDYAALDCVIIKPICFSDAPPMY